MENTINLEHLINVAIGQEVALLLSLKISKQGRIKTSWGDKTFIGLGAVIQRIVEEEKEKLNKELNIKENV
jgi:hypothetical protein